ncbi:uncharacterized protein LOC111404470 [Olea europaea var. sylvestris]|uniref:uncharacterized protein LOC111404470 n=1 Tax=Olea europaea var. sylvestris TaxID=158386 RepID=UPI000C1D7BB1|nr:uncharacterized protein LOC111404470 [Olea europaea var. sylvestris]
MGAKEEETNVVEEIFVVALAKAQRFRTRSIVYLHVCLLYGLQFSLALVAHNCSYLTLVDTVMTEFALDPTKDMEREPAKYPIIVDVAEAEIDNTSITVPVNAHSNSEIASIRGWEHCRPVIVVDGTYLNGKYGGTLFTACTQDANNSIFVLTFGIGDNEDDKFWIWFFDKLKKAYGNREGLHFVSDCHPSIKNAIKHVYPGACCGICSYHLLQNLKSYYGKSRQNITQAFNSAVRAYTLEEYDYNMSLVTTMNEKIISYLADVGPEKHKDDAHETFTKLSSKYEKEIRKMSMDLRNLRLYVNGTNLCNMISKSVTYISPSNQTIFSVSNERSTFVVDIEQRTCTYRILQVDLLPCPHILAVITNIRRYPYDYCSYYYTKDAYLNVYQDSVYPVGNQEKCTVPEEVQ